MTRWRVALVLTWLALALFVLLRLLGRGDLPTTLAAWLGGVLSVFFGRLLLDAWRAQRPVPTTRRTL